MVQLVPRGSATNHGAGDCTGAPAAVAPVSRLPRLRRLPPSLQIGGRMGNQIYSVMMQSINTDELYEWAPKLEAASSEVSEARTSPPIWR